MNKVNKKNSGNVISGKKQYEYVPTPIAHISLHSICTAPNSKIFEDIKNKYHGISL
jgi:hypothetical protein